MAWHCTVLPFSWECAAQGAETRATHQPQLKMDGPAGAQTYSHRHAMSWCCVILWERDDRNDRLTGGQNFWGRNSCNGWWNGENRDGADKWRTADSKYSCWFITLEILSVCKVGIACKKYTFLYESWPLHIVTKSNILIGCGFHMWDAFVTSDFDPRPWRIWVRLSSRRCV